ncbi:MAG: hypothetical protein QGF00_37305, partial [Planctomycetota bacterium]|nr:hypothetical protein [Planctomycetota bacterium]
SACRTKGSDVRVRFARRGGYTCRRSVQGTTREPNVTSSSPEKTEVVRGSARCCQVSLDEARSDKHGGYSCFVFRTSTGDRVVAAEIT